MKHFKFSQDSAFFCTPDSSLSVYRVTTSSSHKAPLHIPVNLFPSSPQNYLRKMSCSTPSFCIWCNDRICLTGIAIAETDHTVPEYKLVSNFMKMAQTTTWLAYRSCGSSVYSPCTRIFMELDYKALNSFLECLETTSIKFLTVATNKNCFPSEYLHIQRQVSVSFITYTLRDTPAFFKIAHGTY